MDNAGLDLVDNVDRVLVAVLNGKLFAKDLVAFRDHLLEILPEQLVQQHPRGFDALIVVIVTVVDRNAAHVTRQQLVCHVTYVIGLLDNVGPHVGQKQVRDDFLVVHSFLLVLYFGVGAVVPPIVG